MMVDVAELVDSGMAWHGMQLCLLFEGKQSPTLLINTKL